MPNKKIMNEENMLMLKEMHLAPYIQLATALIGIERHFGGNMFRHQIDTFGILLDYGYIDSVLLKASVVNDLLEDVPATNRNAIADIDSEGPEVLKLVLEVTRREVESKPEFLTRIHDFGSYEARVLKCADRISNIISMGYVTDIVFVKRYIEETEHYVFPIAEMVNARMLDELQKLVETRRTLYCEQQ